MEDLTSRYYPDPVSALVPTSQAGGNRWSERPEAESAPGSKSTAGPVTEAAQPGPFAYVTENPANYSQVTDKSGRK